MEPESIAKDYWSAVQKALRRHGLDPGPVDGVRGPLTDGALIQFKAGRGLHASTYVGPKTEAKLWAKASKPLAGRPAWLEVALRYLGLREIPGARDHPQILAWWEAIGAGWFDDDETPWCGAFVGGTLLEAGKPILPAAEAPRARAWETWGRGLDGPAPGAVVTFWRGSPSSGSGHVAFVLGRNRGDRLVCLGGNQSNAVTVANFDPARVTAYRWPEDEPSPEGASLAALPLVAEDGHISIDER